MSLTTWTFLTNHAHVAVCIARDPAIRLRDLAAKVGITERAAQRIVTDLVREGYLERTRVGRRNHYRVQAHLPLRHPLDHDLKLEALLRALAPQPAAGELDRGLAARARAQRSA